MIDEIRSSPLNVAVAAFRAYEAQDWARIATLADEVSLASFREQQLLMARAMAQHPSVMPTDATPHVHPAVIEFFDSISQLQQISSLSGFARVSSLDELEALTPRELFTRYLEGHAPDPRNYEDGRGPIARRTVIGSVAESDVLTHVVYRITTDVGRYGITEEMSVLSCTKRDDMWSVSLNGDLSSTGSGGTARITNLESLP